MTLFDQEYAVERYGDEKLAQGKIEGKIETAQSMKKKGFQDKLIAEILEVSVDVVHQWLANSSSSSPQLNQNFLPNGNPLLLLADVPIRWDWASALFSVRPKSERPDSLDCATWIIINRKFCTYR